MKRNNWAVWRVLFFFLCAFLPAEAWCQLASDSSFISSAKKNAHSIYHASLGDQIGLFNGSEYIEHYDYRSPKGFPYFQNDDWIDGTITYDSATYTNVGLLYDLVTDKIVLDMEYSHFKLELVSEKVKSFDIAGHHFVRVVRFKNDSSFRSGFYDLLYDGKVKAYARRFKERKENAKVTGIEVEYLDKNHYYIFFNDTYHRVRSRQSVLNVFAAKKKELKKKIRSSGRKINFNKNREESIVQVLSLYDELEP